MGKVENENYYQVSGWMINELKLKGNELLIYAIIYGFTQTCNCFSGGLSYLEEFIGATKPTVLLALRKLTEKGFLIKEKVITDKGVCCVYKTVKNFTQVKNLDQGSKESLPGVVKNLDQGSKESLPNNNIYNNSDNNKYNNTKSTAKKTKTNYEQFLDSLPISDTQKYKKCVDTLYNFRKSKDPKFARSHTELLKWQFEIAMFSQKSDRSADEILETLNYAINDKFWSTRITSQKSLIKAYETLRLQIASCNTNNQKKSGNSNYQQVYTDEEYRAWSDDPAAVPF